MKKITLLFFVLFAVGIYSCDESQIDSVESTELDALSKNGKNGNNGNNGNNNDLPFTDAQREIDELKIGKSLGEKSITTDKRFIRDTDIYKDASISKLANIDEASGVTSSLRRGTTPYGIFGQIIGKEQNTTTNNQYVQQ